MRLIPLYQCNYIDKKSRAFFGKKVSIRFGSEKSTHLSKKDEKQTKNSKGVKTSKNQEDFAHYLNYYTENKADNVRLWKLGNMIP